MDNLLIYLAQSYNYEALNILVEKYKKYIPLWVNEALSNYNVFKDVDKDVIIDDILIPLGKGVKLDGLKRKEKYFFEIKAPPGRFTINAI
mgnify:CR=1 FL=1